MAEEQVTNVVEEYLETIYRLQEKEGNGAKTSDIVKTLNVVPGTVTNTIERLEKEGLVEHEPYRGVRLTEKGRKIAIQVVRRHRLSERLLTDILHVDWGKAHETACKIEHDISDEEIMESIEKALGNPKTCPHGNPIPEKEGAIVEEGGQGWNKRLVDLDVGQGGTIVRLIEENVETLQYASKLQLIPGAFVEVLKKEPTNELMTIRLQGSTIHSISQKVASSIEITAEKRGAREQGRAKPEVESLRTEVERKPSHMAPFAEYEH